MSLQCLFGHDKEFGATIYVICCDSLHGNHRHQIRWVCRRCKAMGADCVKENGRFKVHFGDIVPDEKGWLAGELPGIDQSKEVRPKS